MIFINTGIYSGNLIVGPVGTYLNQMYWWFAQLPKLMENEPKYLAIVISSHP